jgi:predicted nucleic acid-binding protein
MAVILDTSAIVALTDADDSSHHVVNNVLATTKELFVVPLPALTEVDYLIARNVGPSSALEVMRLLVTGDIVIDHLTHADLERATELMRVYADSFIGFVDSSIIALAERLNTTRIVTLDRGHFTFVRPRHCTRFDLLP